MTITNIAKSVPSLIALSTIADASKRGVRKVRSTLRCKTLMPKIAADVAPELLEAMWTLVAAGHTVRLFESNQIWSLTIAADGARVWTSQRSRTNRAHAVVEVAL